jgi:hypothetical protein
MHRVCCHVHCVTHQQIILSSACLFSSLLNSIRVVLEGVRVATTAIVKAVLLWASDPSAKATAAAIGTAATINTIALAAATGLTCTEAQQVITDCHLYYCA